MCPIGPADHLTARSPIRLITPSSNHILEGLGANSEEKREPVGDIDTLVVGSLKALDLNGRLEKQTRRSEANAIWRFTECSPARFLMVRFAFRIQPSSNGTSFLILSKICRNT